MNTHGLFITALISIFTFTSCQDNGTSEKNTENDKQVARLMDDDGGGVAADSGCLTTSIPVDSANKMIGSYLESVGSTGGSAPTGDNMASLIVDARSLRCYLSNPNIVKVKLMFAHTLDYINSGHQGQNAGYGINKLTLVIAGYDAAGNYVLDAKNGVEDYANPCPHNCPTSGTASSNLIE